MIRKTQLLQGGTKDYRGSTTVDYSKHYSRLGICPPLRKNRSQRLKVKGKRNHPPPWPSRSPDVSHPSGDRQHPHVATLVSGASQAPGQNLPDDCSRAVAARVETTSPPTPPQCLARCERHCRHHGSRRHDSASTERCMHIRTDATPEEQ